MEPAGQDRTPRAAPTLVRFAAFGLAGAEQVWRGLEEAGAAATPYQRFSWIAAWQRHVGAPSGTEPLIVVGYGADGAPAMLLPLGVRRRLGCRTAEFLGGRHANFNAAVWRPDALEGATPADAGAVLAFLRGVRPRIDALALFDQPLAWEGAANPLASGRVRPAPHAAWGGRIADLPDRGRPRRLRAKERRMAAIGEIRYFQPETAAETDAVLDAFLAQKAARQRAAGVPDAFSGDDVRAFLREACRPTPDGAPAIELFAMSVGGTIAAVYGGSRAGSRFSFSFNSIADGRLAQHSPGLLLFAGILPLLEARGVSTVDLGIGEARYKRGFCPVAEPLCDLVLANGPRGWAAVAVLLAVQEVKRAVKASPALSGALRAARRLRAAAGRAASAPRRDLGPLDALPTPPNRP